SPLWPLSYGRLLSGPPRRRGAAPTPPRGLGADGVRGARLLRLRRLPRRQRQQQLPHDHGARRRAALRHRLPHAHAHGEVLQRPQHTRHHQRVPRGRARAAVPEPLHARREPARRRQLRVRRRRHPQRHRRAIREHHQDRTAAAELPGLPAEAGGVHRRGRGEGAREPVAGAHHARRQRLRQQLLPGALLRQVPAVRDPRLRPLHHLRVQESPLQRLYELGARRVIVTGTGMIGCVPAELALHSLDGSCAPDLTRAADLFNPQLERMLTELNGEVGHDDVFIAANTNRVSFDFMFNPQQYGFATAKIACCGQGPYNGIGLCTPASNVCANRDVYAYWDAFHPTERANRIIVANFMHGTTDHISPMNLSTILAMDNTRN
uniref:Uncharacterized protein n=1 Tax=Aegilops tauschii subsp. strangulata TaxID=200361 RepID=A0A453CE12_AEGTS